MNFVICAVKLNRFYRRAMDHSYQELPINAQLTDAEMDDHDNMYSGCAFE